jgi:mRNA-degrading endonuclease YafQ of YafQ-DinJ toxin-antitoxin module
MITVLPNPAFDRAVRDLLRKFPHYGDKISKVIDTLKKDIFDPSLKTHKLHGKLKNLYACWVSYDQRIIFSFSNNRVTLITIGSHDQIY